MTKATRWALLSACRIVLAVGVTAARGLWDMTLALAVGTAVAGGSVAVAAWLGWI